MTNRPTGLISRNVAKKRLVPGGVEEIIGRMKAACGAASDTELAVGLQISQASISKARTKDKIPADWFITMSVYHGASIDWLLYGGDDGMAALKRDRDDLLGQLIEKTWDPDRDFIVQVVGLAEGSTKGWEKINRTPMYAAAPVDIHKAGGFGVVAVGPSVKPEGVRGGFLIYCDPGLEPEKDDLVFVEDSEDHGTIKVFLGKAERDGVEYIQLQGWDEPTGTGLDKPQKPYQLEIGAADIKRIATVVYVKRRV